MVEENNHFDDLLSILDQVSNNAATSLKTFCDIAEPESILRDIANGANTKIQRIIALAKIDIEEHS